MSRNKATADASAFNVEDLLAQIARDCAALDAAAKAKSDAWAARIAENKRWRAANPDAPIGGCGGGCA